LVDPEKYIFSCSAVANSSHFGRISIGEGGGTISFAGEYDDRSNRYDPDVAAGSVPGADELWKWLEQLAGWCPAATGSKGHTAFVNFLDQRLRAAKLTPQRKTFKLNYWEPKEWSLKVKDQSVHVTGYRPYSGPTSPAGVTAPLYYAGMNPKLDYSGASGKIVLVEMAPAPRKGDGTRAGKLIGA
jgi:hypothetical protein